MRMEDEICATCGQSLRLKPATGPNQECPPDNPMIALTLHFKDGAGLRQVFKTPVPQSLTMKTLGKMLAELGQELNIELEDNFIKM